MTKAAPRYRIKIYYEDGSIYLIRSRSSLSAALSAAHRLLRFQDVNSCAVVNMANGKVWAVPA